MHLVNIDFLEIYSILKCFATGKITFKLIITEKMICLVYGFVTTAYLSGKKIKLNLKSLPQRLVNFSWI